MREYPLKRFLQRLGGDGEEASRRRADLILLCGVLGMVILFCAQMLPADTAPAAQEPGMAQGVNNALEQRLSGIVENIAGVGRAKVMVTFESGVEYIYAKEERRVTDRYEDTDAASGTSLQQKDNTETSYILVDGGAGKKQALVEKQIEPVVRGVVVLCEGADDPVVERRVTEAVSTALGISTSRICVIKISS